MDLLWERLSNAGFSADPLPRHGNGTNGHRTSRWFVRLPGDTLCAARCKDGRRCRGRIRPGSEYCFFHDPAIPAEQRREYAARGARNRPPRAVLPKGYPRRLDTSAAVQRALDRLYREIRSGLVDAETGHTLLEVLGRLAALHGGAAAPPSGTGPRT